jgi:plastocyanin
VWSLDRTTGTPKWLTPIGDAAHWGNPVAVANGIVYTVDLRGFLDAYDGATGAPVLQFPLVAGGGSNNDPMLSWGGVSIARHTIYASIGINSLADGFVVAMRPGGTGGGVDPGPGPGPLPLPAGPTVVAGPGATYTTYATPVMATPKGGQVSFVNNDLPPHDVTSVAQSGSGAPLFKSKLVGIGEVTPVVGVDKLAAGTYPFYCSIHPGMKGTLAVTG